MEALIETSLILILSLIFMSVGAYFLRLELSRRPAGIGAFGYSRTALRVERNYKIFAWICLEAVMLVALLSSLQTLVADVLAWSL